MMDKRFVWPLRVYYEDTDAAGIVYHANYLRFMERARTEWLRALGFEQDELVRRHQLAFVVVRTDVRYQQPARFNDELVVTTVLERVRGASMNFIQTIADADGHTVCAAHNGVACIDSVSFRPRRIPANLMRAFKGAH